MNIRLTALLGATTAAVIAVASPAAAYVFDAPFDYDAQVRHYATASLPQPVNAHDHDGMTLTAAPGVCDILTQDRIPLERRSENTYWVDFSDYYLAEDSDSTITVYNVACDSGTAYTQALSVYDPLQIRILRDASPYGPPDPYASGSRGWGESSSGSLPEGTAEAVVSVGFTGPEVAVDVLKDGAVDRSYTIAADDDYSSVRVPFTQADAAHSWEVLVRDTFGNQRRTGLPVHNLWALGLAAPGSVTDTSDWYNTCTPLTWFYNADGEPGDAAGSLAGLRRAFDTIAQASGMTFVQVDDPQQATIRFEWSYRVTEPYRVLVQHERHDDDNALGEIAVVDFSQQAVTSKPWYAVKGSKIAKKKSGYRIGREVFFTQAVLQALGMDRVSSPQAFMYDYGMGFFDNKVGAGELTPNEIAGLRMLLGGECS